MRKKKEPKSLNPRIIEYVNEITGESRWRVWKNGWMVPRGPSMPPWSRDFDTREEAEKCFADNFGWVKVKEYQPDA